MPLESLSSLFDAIKAGDCPSLESLLESHPSWVGRTLKGCTLLEAAVYFKHSKSKSIDLINMLIKAGANVNQLSVCFDVQDGSETPLIAAARMGCHKHIVACLIDADANVNAVDGVQQLSALAYTCMVGPSNQKTVTALEVAKLLLDHGAQVNGTLGERSPPIHLAVNQGDNLDMVKLLVSYGANVNSLDADSMVPLHLVRDFATAEFLMEHGACIMPVTNYWLHPVERILGSEAQIAEADKIAWLMISHGASLNVRVIPEVCWSSYMRNLVDFVESGAIPLHRPWRRRGLVESAMERSDKKHLYRRGISVQYWRDVRQFAKPYWDLEEILCCLLPQKRAWLEERWSNPCRLKTLCIDEIRHVLFLKTAGKSILPLLYSLPGPRELHNMVALKRYQVNQKDYSEQVALHKVISPDVASYLVQNGAILLPYSRFLLHPVEAVISSKDKRLFHQRLELVRMMVQHGVELNIKMIPECCRWFYQYYPHFLIKNGAINLHGPWLRRGVIESATERGWYKIAQYARDFVPDIVNDRELVCKRFFWDFVDINERFIADESKSWIQELCRNPVCLQDRCASIIRHVLFTNSRGRSIVLALDKMELPYKMKNLIMRAPPR